MATENVSCSDQFECNSLQPWTPQRKQPCSLICNESAKGVAQRLDGERKTLLGRGLRSWQIFMIAISGVLGTGFIQNTTYALRVAGPSGLILSITTVGVMVVAVMKCVGEMVQLFPTPNFMSEIARTFVDEELGLVIELLYWFSHALIYSGQIISAVNLTDYWNSSYAIKILLWTMVPVLLVALNSIPARWYGAMEEIGGTIKLASVLGIIVMMAVHGVNTNVGSYPLSMSLSPY